MANRNKWQYYTMSDKYHSIRLPISVGGKNASSEYGCDEVGNGDTVYVEGYNAPFRVTLYEKQHFNYIPYLWLKKYKDNTITTYVVGNMALHTLPNHIIARILFFLQFYTSIGVTSVIGVNRDLFSRRLYIINLVYRELIDYLNGLENGNILAKLIQEDWRKNSVRYMQSLLSSKK